MFAQHRRDGRLAGSDASGEPNREHQPDRIIGPIGDDPLYSDLPDERLAAARAAGRRNRKSLERQVENWPENSPAAINAWLLFVTTKPPLWRDNLVIWREHPPTLGQAPEGFWYPDPLGFWAEIRRWAITLFQLVEHGWPVSDVLSLSALIHVGDDSNQMARALKVCRPRVTLFLDEPSWLLSGLQVRQTAHYISDPHRPRQVYEGFWGHTEEGRIVGKAPQHPTMHNLYKAPDMDGFLRAAPVASELSPK